MVTKLGEGESVGTSEPEVEVPLPDTPEAKEPMDTPELKVEDQGDEPDYKALYEETKVSIEKLKNDSKAREGLTLSRKEQDQLMKDVADRVGGLETGFNIWLSREASHDDELAGKVAEAKSEKNNRDQRSAFADIATATLEKFKEALLAEDGTVLLDLQTAPELSHVRKAWNNELDVDNPNPERIRSLLSEVERQGRVKERSLFSAQLTEASAAATQAVEEERDASFDLGVGKGAPSGGGRPELTTDQKMQLGWEKRQKAKSV